MTTQVFGGENDNGGHRPLRRALAKGWRRRCPDCGDSGLFKGYIKVRQACDACGLEFHHHRADDAPPYFTITIVAHIIMPLLLISERTWHFEQWLHMALWLPLTLVLTLFLLPRVKGALIGLQWAKQMHGFGGEEDLPASHL